MNSPCIRLNAGAFHHLPYTFIGLNLLWCLSRGRSDLAFLSSNPSYEIQTFSYPSIWFPHWLESEDHTRPWFCPKLVIFIIFCTCFPHRLESEDHTRPWFCPKLVIFIIFCTWFPHRLESEDHTRPWFCPWAHMLNGPGPRIYWAHKLRGVSITFDHAVPFGVPVFEVHLLETPLTSGLQTTLEVEPETFCL